MGNRRFARDTSGAVFLEFTLVFPIVLVVTLGIVDIGLVLFRFAGLNKATYDGARFAVVNAPVATGVNAPTQAANGSVLGQSCSNAAGTPGACQEIDIYCIADATTGGSCKKADGTNSSFTFNNTAFTAILTEMNRVSLGVPITRQQVKISYQTSGLGYVGRVQGSPMNVTVSIRCKTVPLFFLDSLVGWTFSSPSGCSDISPAPAAGIVTPAFSTTLPSEDMA